MLTTAGELLARVAKAQHCDPGDRGADSEVHSLRTWETGSRETHDAALLWSDGRDSPRSVCLAPRPDLSEPHPGIEDEHADVPDLPFADAHDVDTAVPE